MFKQNLKIMEKKNPKLDLLKRRPLFFNIGLCLAIGMALMAFEWKTTLTTAIVEKTYIEFDNPTLEIPPTVHPVKPPPPKVFNLIETKQENIEEPEIDIDVIIDEGTTIPDIVFIDEPKPEEAEIIWDIVESEPSFMNGGRTAFLKYVSERLRYPSHARKIGIEGKVFVQFVVDKSGQMTDIQVIKGIGAGCDEEVLRILKEAPKWSPGKQRGVPVKVRMVVPVHFQLN